MLVGRKSERNELLRAYNSEYSEFVAVTGRRRVGKTFLIRETFGYKFAFQHSGLANQKTKEQLKEFRLSLIKSGMKKCRVPTDWFDAFFLLSEFLDSKRKGKKVVFIDELPWMDAPRSNFVSALEHFWNSYASARKDILLIICGSATSWIINNVFRNHGGLHNRVTYRIHLQPFTLNECEQYAQSRHLKMSRFELLETYMVMGGVPFYWSLLEQGKSAAQNIDNLLFSPTGKLHYEYKELYDSLYKNPEPYLNVVSSLGAKKMGLTREELIKEGHITNNGQLTKVLQDLEACGFIRKYSYKGIKRSNAIFQLIDNYTLFYYHFLHDATGTDEQVNATLANVSADAEATPVAVAITAIALDRTAGTVSISADTEGATVGSFASEIYTIPAGSDTLELTCKVLHRDSLDSGDWTVIKTEKVTIDGKSYTPQRNDFDRLKYAGQKFFTKICQKLLTSQKLFAILASVKRF